MANTIANIAVGCSLNTISFNIASPAVSCLNQNNLIVNGANSIFTTTLPFPYATALNSLHIQDTNNNGACYQLWSSIKVKERIDTHNTDPTAHPVFDSIRISDTNNDNIQRLLLENSAAGSYIRVFGSGSGAASNHTNESLTICRYNTVDGNLVALNVFSDAVSVTSDDFNVTGLYTTFVNAGGVFDVSCGTFNMTATTKFEATTPIFNVTGESSTYDLTGVFSISNCTQFNIVSASTSVNIGTPAFNVTGANATFTHTDGIFDVNCATFNADVTSAFNVNGSAFFSSTLDVASEIRSKAVGTQSQRVALLTDSNISYLQIFGAGATPNVSDHNNEIFRISRYATPTSPLKEIALYADNINLNGNTNIVGDLDVTGTITDNNTVYYETLFSVGDYVSATDTYDIISGTYTIGLDGEIMVGITRNPDMIDLSNYYIFPAAMYNTNYNFLNLYNSTPLILPSYGTYKVEVQIIDDCIANALNVPTQNIEIHAEVCDIYDTNISGRKVCRARYWEPVLDDTQSENLINDAMATCVRKSWRLPVFETDGIYNGYYDYVSDPRTNPYPDESRDTFKSFIFRTDRPADGVYQCFTQQATWNNGSPPSYSATHEHFNSTGIAHRCGLNISLHLPAITGAYQKLRFFIRIIKL